MSIHDDIRSALRDMGHVLERVDSTATEVESQAGDLYDSLDKLSGVRKENAHGVSDRLDQIGGQIVEDTHAVEAAQTEVNHRFDYLHVQKHKSLTLVKWRFRQARRTMQEQHSEHLRGMEDVRVRMYQYTDTVAESYGSEYELWGKHVDCDRSQIEIGGNIVQRLDTVQQLARVRENVIIEGYKRTRREKAVQLNEMGAKSLAVGLYNEAVNKLIQAADLCPEEYAIRINLGWAYLMAGQSADARDEAMKGIEIAETATEAYHLLGHVELKEGNAEDAIQAFEKAKELDPDSERNALGLGLAYMANEEYHIALNHWRRIASEVPVFKEYSLLAP